VTGALVVGAGVFEEGARVTVGLEVVGLEVGCWVLGSDTTNGSAMLLRLSSSP